MVRTTSLASPWTKHVEESWLLSWPTRVKRLATITLASPLQHGSKLSIISLRWIALMQMVVQRIVEAAITSLPTGQRLTTRQMIVSNTSAEVQFSSPGTTTTEPSRRPSQRVSTTARCTFSTIQTKLSETGIQHSHLLSGSG